MGSDHSGFFEKAEYSSYWWEAAPLLKQNSDDVFSDKDIDVAIIGGGFTGISAALTLAKAGKKVIVLDQNAIGSGASTRNGGQIGSGNQKVPINVLVDRFGTSKAKEILKEGLQMLAYLKQLIADEKINCDLQEVGRFRGAVHLKHYDAMAREMEALNKYTKVEYYMVPKSEQHQEIDSDFYYGGYVLPNDGLVHPGKLHRGIVEAAINSGVIFQANTTVTGVQKSVGGFCLNTSRGDLIARDVILSTNGYGGQADCKVESRIVPVGSAVIATEKLPEERVKRLLANMRAYGNSAHVIHYYRPSPDGRRIVWGGRVGRWGDHVPQTEKQNNWRAFSHLRKDMVSVFPGLKDIHIDFCWTGLVGISFDDMPHIGVDKTGVHYACGYCGTGVTRSVYLGSKIAQVVINDQAGSKSCFAEEPLPSHPFQVVAPKIVPLVERWYSFRDWSGW